MQTIHTNVYPYDELQPAAQEKARDWYRRGMEDETFWQEHILEEDAPQCGILLGLKVDRIYYSGFSSQGDGACFEGSWAAFAVVPGGVAGHVGEEGLDAELRRIGAEFERLAKLYPDASFSVKQRGHYYHKNCTEFDCDFDGDNKLTDDQYLAVENELKEAARDFMDWIYASLEKEWDYMNSDEQVVEAILANDYTFTAEGKRFG